MKSINDLEPLFNPQSIAIIGASSDFSKVSGRPLMFLLEHGYAGQIYPINPKCDQIAGIKCYKSLSEVPEEIDLATIIVPARHVLGAMRECAARGVKAVSIITSGFAEMGTEGRKLQEQIRDLARSSGMRMSGPNSVGFHNFRTKAFASISQLFEKKDLVTGPIAFISQSGAFGTAICALAQERKIGFTYFVSSGNEADLELADYMEYAADDSRIKVIAGYVEGIKDGKKFLRVARKCLEKAKPIVLTKVGRFNAGTRAASSHTGSMTGSDAVYEAVFGQTGIIRAYDVEELLDYSNMFALASVRSGRNVAVISTSGGAGVLMADKCEELGLGVPELAEPTRKRLQELLPPFSAVGNPVDVTGQFLTMPGAIKGCVEVLAQDDEVDVIVLFLALVWSHGEQIAKDIVDVSRSINKPLAVCWMAAPESGLTILRDNGIVVYIDPVRCIKSLHVLLHYGRLREQLVGEASDKASACVQDQKVSHVTEQLNTLKEAGRVVLSEHESKQILSEYGIPVTRERLAATVGEALTYAQEIGWPVALKISSPDIAHKTEAGAIALNVADAEHLKRTFDELWGNALAYNPGARIDGVLVQEMLGPGKELIVGVSQDPQFGPVIMFGLGGIFVELLRDVSLRVCPITRADAIRMIRSIKGFSLLEGFRGGKPADIDAVSDVLVKVSQLALELQDCVSELDINPLVVFEQGDGVKAADALISLRSGLPSGQGKRPS